MSTEEGVKLHSGLSAKDLERLGRMRLMDDDFFNEALDKKIEAVQYIIDTVLGRSDIRVTETKSQYVYYSAVSRSIRLDIWAIDVEGQVVDVEVQLTDDPDLIERARYYAGMIDSRLLPKGKKFGNMPKRYVIMITGKDKLGRGKPLYHMHYTIDEWDGSSAGDGGMIIFVNGEFRDESHPIGRLVHDLWCTRADDMYSHILAKEVRALKETEGGQEHMCEVFEEVRAEGEMKMLYELVNEGDLSISKAAQKAKETEEEFKKGMDAYFLKLEFAV